MEVNLKLSSFLTQTAFWSINKELAHNIGRDEAFLLSDLISKYEYYKSINQLIEYDDEICFYATSESIEKDTMFTYFQQKKLITNLENFKLLKTKRKGVPAKLYFHIIESNIAMYFKSSIEETSNQEFEKLQIKNSRNFKSIYNNNKNKIIRNKYKYDFSNFNQDYIQLLIEFLELRSKIKKPIKTQNCLNQRYNNLYKLSNGNLEVAKLICKRTIDNEWQDFYELPKNINTEEIKTNNIISKFVKV